MTKINESSKTDYSQYITGCSLEEEIKAYSECGGPDIEGSIESIVKTELKNQSQVHPFIGLERSGEYVTIKRGGFFPETFIILRG